MKLVALVQGIYFLITGLWPVLSMRTFLAVTGPKTDLWLVRTVGLLIGAIGLSLTVAGWRGELAAAEVTLALAGAGALAAVDLHYGFKKVIGPAYLGDAVLELVFLGWWVVSLW